MARVIPFRPYRYTKQAGDPSNLVTQPYDKIPDELREKYLAASPYNFVRLIKGKAESNDDERHNVYSRAAELLDQWIRDGILKQDEEPAFYAYSQQFTHPDSGARMMRQGFIGLLELEEYENKVVHRHERTHSGPKLDRLQLTEATQAHFGQLFLLYDDPSRRIDKLLAAAAAAEPLMQAQEEGVIHRITRIDQPQAIAEIEDVMADKKLLIADGHHRYETALAYARAHADIPGASRVMLTLVNMRSEGLLALATHRLIHGLPDFSASRLLEQVQQRFKLAVFPSADALQQALEAAPSEAAAIGLVLNGDPDFYLLAQQTQETPRRPDVVVLHEDLITETLDISGQEVLELQRIRYVRGLAEAVAAVRSGSAQVGFLLRPVDVQQVAEIAFSGGVLPQKSTDFYPKLFSGFTAYCFGRPTARSPKD